MLARELSTKRLLSPVRLARALAEQPSVEWRPLAIEAIEELERLAALQLGVGDVAEPAATLDVIAEVQGVLNEESIRKAMIAIDLLDRFDAAREGATATLIELSEMIVTLDREQRLDTAIDAAMLKHHDLLLKLAG